MRSLQPLMSLLPSIDVERIKTIGDTYLAVFGMPNTVQDHASLITSAAFKMRGYIQFRNLNHKHQWRCRIGIHTGEVTGSVLVHRLFPRLFRFLIRRINSDLNH